MTDCKLVPVEPTPDVPGLVEALEARRDDLRWMSLRYNYHNQTVEEADAALTAPDVAQLVEALETLLAVRVVEADVGYGRACAKAEHALAAHRKQGGE